MSRQGRPSQGKASWLCYNIHRAGVSEAMLQNAKLYFSVKDQKAMLNIQEQRCTSAKSDGKA